MRRRLMVLLVSAAAVSAVNAATRLPWTPPGDGAAVLRYSWRMNIQARERCRARTPEELETLPVHMRTPEVCEPDDASYLLITRVGSAAPDTAALLRGGARGDRPLFVLRSEDREPGRQALHVRLERAASDGSSTIASLDTTVVLRPGVVTLVTMNDVGTALTVRSTDD